MNRSLVFDLAAEQLHLAPRRRLVFRSTGQAGQAQLQAASSKTSSKLSRAATSYKERRPQEPVASLQLLVCQKEQLQALRKDLPSVEQQRIYIFLTISQ